VVGVGAVVVVTVTVVVAVVGAFVVGAVGVVGAAGEREQATARAAVIANAPARPSANRRAATAAYGSEVTGAVGRRPWWIGAVVGLLLAGCGGGGTTVTSAATTAVPSTPAAAAAPATSTATATTPPPAPPPAPTVTGGPAVTQAPAVATGPAGLDRAGAARQALVVTARAYGSTTATLTTWQRAGAGWAAVGGPWPADVGRAGFAPPGAKREGDGRTPSGTFGFDFAFGVRPDPGVHLPFRRVTGPSIVWDDVPSSPSYNQWVDGGRGEAMDVSPAYDYGVVIAYNTDRTPGLGSAIFLHVSTGRPTSGCVSLPVDRLLEVLRWLDPAQAPVIVMGVA